MENQKPKKSKAIRIGIYLAILFVMSLLGIVLGVFYHANADTVFVSEASIAINTKELNPKIDALDFSRVTDVRHDQLIPQKRYISQCLSQNKLMQLRCFEHLSEDKIAPTIIENLEVTQNVAEPSVYKLVFHCSRPDDAQTILNNIVHTYETDLAEQQSQIVYDYRTNLRATADEIERQIKNGEKMSEQELAQANETKAEIQKKQSALSLAGLTDNGRSEGVVELSILESATYGDPVWPILPLIALGGAAIGFALGMLLILFSSILEKLA